VIARFFGGQNPSGKKIEVADKEGKRQSPIRLKTHYRPTGRLGLVQLPSMKIDDKKI